VGALERDAARVFGHLPSGDLAEVIDRALTVLLKDVFYGHGRPTERRTLPGKSQQPSPKGDDEQG